MRRGSGVAGAASVFRGPPHIGALGVAPPSTGPLAPPQPRVSVGCGVLLLMSSLSVAALADDSGVDTHLACAFAGVCTGGAGAGGVSAGAAGPEGAGAGASGVVRGVPG